MKKVIKFANGAEIRIEDISDGEIRGTFEHLWFIDENGEMKMTIEEKLDQYASLVEQQETLQKQMQELIDKVPVPQKVIDQWNSIKAEFQPMIDATTQNVEALKQEIQTVVLESKATAHGSKYMAVYVSGKKSWDGKKLEGYAMDHPEILQAQKIGEPTVTFRKVK